MRKLLVVCLCVGSLAMMALPASASARRLTETTCEMHVQAPWAYVDLNGNTWIKDNAHVTCTHNVDVIEVTASLLRQEVAAGSNPELLKTQTVDCTNADYCQAIVKFDVPDNPSKVWVWWEHANGYIKDADGFDHDVKDSGYLAWPWE